MKKNFYYLIIVLIFAYLSSIYYISFIKAGNTLTSRLRGRIVLQVETNGEAWYISPLTNERYYLGRPDDAFALMKNFGQGISNKNLKQIPIAEANFNGPDDDRDGLSNALEDALGTDKNNPDTDHDGFDDKTEILLSYNPLDQSKYLLDKKFTQKQSGQILIQAEQNGEAWYINPNDNKRYFLGRPRDAWEIMRQTALGITNSDLALIAEHKPNPLLQNQTIIQNNTHLIGNKRKYTNTNYQFSLAYPSDWKIQKIAGHKETIILRDYKNDIIKEGGSVINISFITSNEIIELSRFKTATKDGGLKKKSKLEQINNLKSLTEQYIFPQIDGHETTTFVQKNEHEMLMLTMFSADEHNSYDTIFRNIINSIEFK